MAEVQRIPQIDGLRAIAILMVFAGHAFGTPLSWMGVDLFFVLSGYLITIEMLQHQRRDTAFSSHDREMDQDWEHERRPRRPHGHAADFGKRTGDIWQ